MTVLNTQTIVLQSQTSGLRYRLYVRPSGVMTLQSQAFVPIQPDEVTSRQLLTLVNEERAAGYRLQVKDTDLANPLLILKTLEPGHLGQAQPAAYLLGADGREFELFVRGHLVMLRPISKTWPHRDPPILEDPSGRPWKSAVGDAQILTWTDDSTEIHRRSCILLSLDDGGKHAFKLRVANTEGVIEVTDDGLTAESPAFYTPHYFVEFVSPGQIHWWLSVNAQGILAVDPVETFATELDEWPVVLQEQSGQLICVDRYTSKLLRKPHAARS